MLHIYTDGATLPKNPGPSAWGYVILADDHETPLAESSGMWRYSTNQRAELQAITAALIRCRTVEGSNEGLRIYSDSQYAINCLSKWWKKWARQGWHRRKKKGKGQEVKNLDIIRAGVEAQTGFAIDWQWVRGHSGVRWNEYVDEIVNKAAYLAAEAGNLDSGYADDADDADDVESEQEEYERARLSSLFG